MRPLMITTPGQEEAAAMGRLRLAAWLETYPDPAAGIDREWITATCGHWAADQGASEWRGFLAKVERDPDGHFCRAVRDGVGGEPVGMVCGVRAERVSLGPMYLLGPAQGRGLGGRLMAEFLEWAGPELPIALWVTEYNRGAVRFYRRHGFTETGERQLWAGRLPNLRMVRPAARASRTRRHDDHFHGAAAGGPGHSCDS
ncbi:GNAT family N-acetyltransferase [Kitasatospora sp. NPDC006697]|uniref:GNAT family N-acetyltransferase n=1 Tax=Kitasatospora sp. NPDC006697 TaxID=3364020 RepID=UPI0036C7AA2A